VKSRFLLESIIGPRTLESALQLTASVSLYAQDQEDLPLILIDDHLPYPKAILQVFGDIKHGRRKNGRGRYKHPQLKPPPDLQVGVVKKLRDQNGNLLKVSSKALFGKKKEIEKRIRKLGIGCKINTSHMERLNGTIRGQQARLIRRTRAGSHRQEFLQYSIWLWRDLYNWTRPHYSLLEATPAMALRLTKEVWTVMQYIWHPTHVSELQHQEWAEQRNSVLESAVEVYKRYKTLPIS
jgi:hypothetical protein